MTCETCPHFLVLDEDDAAELGAVAKCAPPLRARAEGDALWSLLAAGEIDLVASDHSPAPPELRAGDDLFAAWGGIAGAQMLLAVVWSEGAAARGLPALAIARLCATAAAERFGLAPTKGALRVGADADLVLVDPSGAWTVAAVADLHDRHRLSPFLGRRLRGRVVRTWLRGRTIAVDGAPVGEPAGRVVRPRRS